ncbi:MAG TPA: type II secretion system minor pseudopilin GspI [Gammaproteobacteria bacterium]|nr:type II secretion system minor pseudopilin GspI [Gammaproteobacteria bacterium]
MAEPRRERGFTLLEVLAALAVVAFAVAALWKGLGQGIQVTQGLPERVVARWVAQNRLVLLQARGDWPEPRSYSGSEEMAGRRWFWSEQVSTTDEERLRRVTVRVGTDKEDPSLASMEGYLLHRAPPQPVGEGDGSGGEAPQ